MPPNLRPRYSPSGAFMPGAGELEGFVRRVWDISNLELVTVDEGGPWTTLVDVPIVLAATDQPFAELSWVVEGWVIFTIEQPPAEEPQPFPCSLVLQSETALGVPSTPIVKEVLSWPWTTDDTNVLYNDGYARFMFSQPSFPFGVGTNHFRLQLVFFGGGAHEARIAAADARLSVIELQGPPVAYA